MRIVVSGSSGLVGRALTELFVAQGDETIRLVRRPAEDPGEVFWDPGEGRIDLEPAGAVDAVVHLAGESLAGALRWTEGHKRRIRESRVTGTRMVARALAKMTDKPSVLVSASAVGIYGDRGDEEIDEESSPGQGFLADVCRAWEAATGEAEAAGVRVVPLRVGMVLSGRGGALSAMLPLFRLGLGGRLGSGKQWMSWIALPDLVRIIRTAVHDPAFRGPVNAVAPEPVRNAEFTKVLGAVLGRPTPFPAPAFALRLALGEMADEMLLGGARVSPRRLLEAGFAFRTPTLEPALREALQETG